MARSDHDSWDLADSVGATATMVAAGRARATRDGLIDDRYAEPLVAAVGVDFFSRWATGELSAADVDVPGLPWGMQPMTNLLAVRTRHIDAFCAAAVRAGVTQTVILAAGLDARGYRLDWPAGAVVFEIDQPQVLEFKRATLADLGAAPNTDLRFVPMDLRDDWPAALRTAGFDADRPTAWLAEGLLAFLPPDAQDRLLDTVTALSADGSRLLAEVFMTTSATADVQRQINQRWYDRGLDVSLDDLGYPGERADPADYLAARNWAVHRAALSQLLTEAGLADAQSPPGAVADNYYCTAIRAPH